jgi:hypothetical protein
MSIKWSFVSVVGQLALEYRGMLVTNIAVEVTSRDSRDWTVVAGHRHSDGEGREEFDNPITMEIQAEGIETAMETIEGIMPEIEEELRQQLDRKMRHVWRILEAQSGQVVDREYLNTCWRCKQAVKQVRIAPGEYMDVLVVDGRTTAIPMELHKYL